MGIRNLQLPTNLPSNLSNIAPVIDITNQLPKNPSYTWAQLCGERDLNKLTDIVVHHSGMKKSLGCTAESHANSHIRLTKNEDNGDPGIPYHIYIGAGIYQTNDLLDFIYGVSNNNGYTVHICVEGNFLYDAFTEMDRLHLYAAILSCKAVMPNFKSIKGHNEYNRTDCPAIDMNRVRADIQALEMQMQYEQSPQGYAKTAYSIGNQILYLYNLGNGKRPDGSPATAGEKEWGIQVLLKLKPFMDQNNIQY